MKPKWYPYLGQRQKKGPKIVMSMSQENFGDFIHQICEATCGNSGPENGKLNENLIGLEEDIQFYIDSREDSEAKLALSWDYDFSTNPPKARGKTWIIEVKHPPV